MRTPDQLSQAMVAKAVDYAKSCIGDAKVATYIPELAKADAEDLAVSMALRDGRRFQSGMADKRFTIQSVSKVVTLLYALETRGFQNVFEKVGMEPTGDAFNSFLKLETVDEKPFNPLINAGAIVVTSCVTQKKAFSGLLRFTQSLCMDSGIQLDEAVYQSERKTGARNRSMAHLLASKGVIEADVDKCLDLYFKMCSLSVTADSLANLGAVLSSGGINPWTGKRLIQEWTARIVKTLMLTCGMYDGSGEFAIRVGLPSKSGVGGGIVSCGPDGMGIGVYGPALDAKGNSIGGIRILEYLSHHLDLHCLN